MCTVGLVPGSARLMGTAAAGVVGGMGLRRAFTGEVGAAQARGVIMACAADQQSARGTSAGCMVLLQRLCSGGQPQTLGAGRGGAPLPTQWELALSLVHEPCVGPGRGE